MKHRTIFLPPSRGAPRGRGPPSDLKKHYIFSFFPLNCVTCIFAAYILKLFTYYVGERTKPAVGTVENLRKVDFSHPFGLYTYIKISARPPLENPGCAPASEHFFW